MLSFTDDFQHFDLARWTTTFSWGGRNLAGPGGSGELQQYVDPGYRHLGLNPFAIVTGDCRADSDDVRTTATLGSNDSTDSGDLSGRPCSGGAEGQHRRLAIRADAVPIDRLAQFEGQRYTSGLLTTLRSFRQKYGYFEMRAKLPRGRGLWPAFWLLPIDGSWPPEIDVVEGLGDHPTTLYATVHQRGLLTKDKSTGFEIEVADMTTSFHRYGLLWTPQYLAWYFDGHRVAYTRTPAGLDTPMYLLVNLAVGGKWAGAPDRTAQFPAELLIDYIRAFTLPAAGAEQRDSPAH